MLFKVSVTWLSFAFNSLFLTDYDELCFNFKLYSIKLDLITIAIPISFIYMSTHIRINTIWDSVSQIEPDSYCYFGGCCCICTLYASRGWTRALWAGGKHLRPVWVVMYTQRIDPRTRHLGQMKFWRENSSITLDYVSGVLVYFGIKYNYWTVKNKFNKIFCAHCENVIQKSNAQYILWPFQNIP